MTVVRPHIFSTEHGSTEYYAPVLLTPQHILRNAQTAHAIERVRDLTAQLESDGYTALMLDFYRAGLHAYGDMWHYADIVSVLHETARLIKPRNYLEIGVRRGRSLAAVVSAGIDTEVYAFDRWTTNYGHNPNPGPVFVQDEMKRFGYTREIHFINGDSHETLPVFFEKNPDLQFDLITVDGDHSYDGARQDLQDVLPHLATGGVIVFDDIAHPRLLHLHKAWLDAVHDDGGLRTSEYTDLGYGVAVGIRFWPRGGSLEQR